MRSPVLQICPLYESHTGQINAVNEAGLGLQIGCFDQEGGFLLQLPSHKLIHDVTIRWNSTYDMSEGYLEQQAAIHSALTDKALKKNVRDIITLSDDVKVAEEVLQLVKPFKMVTTASASENNNLTIHGPK